MYINAVQIMHSVVMEVLYAYVLRNIHVYKYSWSSSRTLLYVGT